jgi:hypothetical protein
MGIFSINSGTGMISISNLKLVDLKNSSFTLWVTVSDGLNTSAAELVTITLPDKITVCHKGQLLSVSKMSAIGHIQHGDCVGACGAATITSGSRNVEENTMNNIQVHPNPVQDKINISLGANNEHIKKIQVVDLSGRVILQTTVTNQSHLMIPAGKLNAGVYMIKMYGDKVITRKIIIE